MINYCSEIVNEKVENLYQEKAQPGNTASSVCQKEESTREHIIIIWLINNNTIKN